MSFCVLFLSTFLFLIFIPKPHLLPGLPRTIVVIRVDLVRDEDLHVKEIDGKCRAEQLVVEELMEVSCRYDFWALCASRE